MGKVSVALRGWRFDEEDVFTEEGELRPIDRMDPDTRERLVRLTVIAGSPCDACWLIHGDENLEQCNVADVVYGEPLHEVVLCPEHERDLVYWFQHEGGRDLVGDGEAFEEEFYDWFDAGNRAPDSFEGPEHVETDPEKVPDPNPEIEMPTLEEELESMDQEELEALDVDLDDLDL